MKYDLFDAAGTRLGRADTPCPELVRKHYPNADITQVDDTYLVTVGWRIVAKYLPATEADKDGSCPKCGAATKFMRTALMCGTHGFVGGF